ncbi:MAG TPA: hypothetical protein VGB52_05930 [Actinomycetota bacterium]
MTATLVTLAAAVIVAFQIPRAGAPSTRLVNEGSPARTIGERLLFHGDGRFYARLARDPLMEHPEWNVSVEETAYRWQRPVAVYAAWLLALGDPTRVTGALVAVSLLGMGFAAFWFALLAQRHGRSHRWGLTVLLIPGLLSGLSWLSPESLGVGLALAGVFTGNVVWLVLAGLCRESLLVVPVVLLIRSRAPRYLWPLVVFGSWAVLVRVRVGAWFYDAAPGGFGAIFRMGADRVQEPDAHLLILGITAACLVFAIKRGGLYGWLVIGYAGLTLFLGEPVLGRWQDYTRPLAPLYAFAVLAVLQDCVERNVSSNTPEPRARAGLQAATRE